MSNSNVCDVCTILSKAQRFTDFVQYSRRSKYCDTCIQMIYDIRENMWPILCGSGSNNHESEVINIALLAVYNEDSLINNIFKAANIIKTRHLDGLCTCACNEDGAGIWNSANMLLMYKKPQFSTCNFSVLCPNKSSILMNNPTLYHNYNGINCWGKINK